MQKRLASTREVLDYLGISKDLLRRMMRSTPDDFAERPWVDLGTSKKPLLRWHMGPELLSWAQSTRRWRVAPTGKPDVGKWLEKALADSEPSGRTKKGDKKRRVIVQDRGALRTNTRSPLMRYAIKQAEES